MNMVKVAKALSSKIRCSLLRLSGESLSLSEIFQECLEYGLKPVRIETIYRHLEILVDAGLLEKQYYKNDKRVKYIRTVTELRFNLSTSEIFSISGNDKNDKRNR